MKKLSNNEADLKKSVACKKKCVIPLNCVSGDVHPIFGWIQFILNLKNKKYTMLFKDYLNIDSKIFGI